MAEDFYDTLGISREASDSEIKSAYRKLAMKYHPDRNQGDSAAEQKFKDVSQAYEILKDPKKRQTYDQFGHAAFEQGGGGAGGFGQQGLVGQIHRLHHRLVQKQHGQIDHKFVFFLDLLKFHMLDSHP